MANPMPTLNLDIPHEARLSERIESLITHPPDTEYSYYGPIDALLNLYFTLEGYWMVKPQAPIRDLAAGHGSADSTDRTVNRNGREAKRADFIVVRFSSTGRQDVVSLVIEIKPTSLTRDNNDIFDEGFHQLARYTLLLNRGLLQARGGEGQMRALLIVGITCHCFRVGVDGALERTDDLPVDGTSILSNEFRLFLLGRIAGAQPAP